MGSVLISHIAFLGSASACCGAIYCAENNKRTGFFAIFVFLAMAGIVEIGTYNRWIAIAASFAVILTIWMASKTKYRLTKFALVYNDVFFFDLNVYRDIFRTYWKDAATVALAAAAALSMIPTALLLAGEDRNHAGIVYAYLAISATGAWLLLPHAMKEYRRANFDGRHISTFFATMLSQRLRPSEMTHLELRLGPLVPNVDRAPMPVDKAPHIVLIGAESTFAPRLLNLPEEPEIAQFFEGTEGCRELDVEIFGGQTILSHTSCLTGLSTRLFGDNRSYAPRFWKGRIGVSLPFFLKSHGYSVRAFLSGQRDWMGIGGLYESIGVDQVFEACDYVASKDVDAMHARDASVYGAALADIRTRIEQGSQRTCTILETMRNHGPHDRTLLEETRELTSKAWFVGNCKSLHPPLRGQAAEWYGRLRASADDLAEFKAKLQLCFPAETFLIVHYGDHQPAFCADVPEITPATMHKTYLTVDWVGQPPPASRTYPHESLPIFYIDLLVAEAAGLPLDGFLAAKAGIAACGFGSTSFENPQYQGLVASLVRAGKLRPQSVSINPAANLAGMVR